MKSKLLVIVFILISSFGFSQKHEISGKVMDGSSGVPLPGVNITVKNTSQAIATDVDGKFKFSNVSKGSTLVFSYIGYQNFELKVTQSQEITVSLKESKNSLDEVVVLGYSSKKKKDVTGAVTIIGSKTIDQLKPIKVEQALQGTVAGVTVTAQSGAPGERLNIKVRGVATNINSDATVLIDGVKGDIGILNPDDIESITVLKDAQAAIYGTIGANGIVLVITKQGKKNSKPKVSFNSYTGFQETTKKIDVLNATEYALLLNESYANGGQSLPFPNVSNLGTGTDWQDEVFQKSPITNNDFTVSGGSEKITYSLSGSDLKQQGIIGGSKSRFNRSTARLNVGIDLTSKLKLQTNLIFTNIKSRGLNTSGLGSVLFNALNAPSTLSVYDQNGQYSLIPSTTGFGTEVINSLAQIENTFNDYSLKKLNGSVNLGYNITDELKLTSRVGFNSGNSLGRSFAKKISYGGKVFDVNRSRVDQNAINDSDYTFDLFAEYSKSFIENHKIKFTVGTTIFKELGSGLFASGYDVPNNDYQFADINLALGTSDGRDVSAYSYDERRLSHFAFLDYSYKGKYLISGTIRRDLSTKFGPGNRIGIFPGVTAGWIITEENLFKNNSTVNFFKLRASYGILGNDQFGNNKYIGGLTGEGVYLFNNQLNAGTAIGVLPNPNIKWEQAKKIDIGVDLKLFNNKIEITSDYFDETRDDLLINNVPVSGITGVSAPGSGSPTVNAGRVNNKGIEFSINYKDNLSDDLNFNIGFNLLKLKNEVTKVDNQTGFIEGGSFGVSQPAPARMEVGQPLGYFYGYQTEGIFQNQSEINAHADQNGLGSLTVPGDIKFKDINGDGKIDLTDRTNIGSAIADYTFGLNLNLNYKNIDFVAYTYASLGNEMVRNYERVLSDVNKLNYTLDRWTGEGTSNNVPRVTTGASNNNLFSDYYVEDASFVRIQNIQLGYSFNKKIIEKIGMTKVRLYASVNNLYTFTKYKGYDPAALQGYRPDRPDDSIIGFGIDSGFYPTPKTYMFGINLIF
ncbi:MAG: TonB-dependent receptor [Flavobacterium sp.]|uniref:SusC/RagA family TonB-linked outer membrane protein n=1 Tax=Flavobacterium sp. TaxID=239 RepID=UPI0022BD3C1D|nr:TonB-dependent receptor [Flavobacterium sp.]MCZ8197641.1 TonB-dependent receptor [Flavobacterium sp.]